MNFKERFNATMHYQPVDRVPLMDFGFWNETIPEWEAQGLPAELAKWGGGNRWDITKWMGMDGGWNTYGPVGMMPAMETQVIEETAEYVVYRDSTGVLLKESRTSRSIPLYLDWLLKDRATVDLFEEAAACGHGPTLAKQFLGFWAALANARNCTIAGLGIEAERLGELSRITADGQINATAAQAIADRMLASADGPLAIAQQAGLLQVHDEGQMRAWVEQAFAANEKAVHDALANPKKKQQARGFLTGQVMKISGGKADPKVVGKLIDERLSRSDEN